MGQDSSREERFKIVHALCASAVQATSAQQEIGELEDYQHGDRDKLIIERDTAVDHFYVMLRAVVLESAGLLA